MIKIITDGASCGNPGPIGIGIVIDHDGNIEKIQITPQRSGTNNEAELLAIKLALEKAVERNYTDLELTTDSQFSVDLLKGFKKTKKPHLNQILLEIGLLKKHFKSVNINWTPRINTSSADELANSACGIKQDICNKCGKKMVIRYRHSDNYPFWGCTGFPQCNNTINISKEDANNILSAKQAYKH